MMGIDSVSQRLACSLVEDRRASYRYCALLSAALSAAHIVASWRPLTTLFWTSAIFWPSFQMPLNSLVYRCFGYMEWLDCQISRLQSRCDQCRRGGGDVVVMMPKVGGCSGIGGKFIGGLAAVFETNKSLGGLIPCFI